MTGFSTGGILSAARTNANTHRNGRWWVCQLAVAMSLMLAGSSPAAEDSPPAMQQITETEAVVWDFGRETDRTFDGWPDGWQRRRGIGYPDYVMVTIKPHDPKLQEDFVKLDTTVLKNWPAIRKQFPNLPKLPPSITDAVIDRYLQVKLDGGQAMVQTSRVAVSRLYQYRFECRIMTQGLRYDTAHAELVFLDADGTVIATHPTEKLSGTTPWTKVQVDRLQPPPKSVAMMVRLSVEHSEDGREDINGVIGFDDLRIDQYPQLQVSTDQPRGIYWQGQSITATARVMGLPMGKSKVRFRLYSDEDEQIATSLVSVDPSVARRIQAGEDVDSTNSELTWQLPRLPRGYYRITAALEGRDASTLETETTLAVIGKLVDGGPHGSFGWTLPEGNPSMQPREFASWLASLGVAWLKYPCWLAPEDIEEAERVANIFSKLQDAGIQTVGMLDEPPEDQVPLYNLRGRREMVAARLFREVEVWQPLLEPVMTRLTLKVRTWQLGGDRDYSFLGRLRLRDLVTQISTGLQGFGQPIDVVISWPWLEPELSQRESSWQAICRSSDPPLGAKELDAFLELSESDTRSDGPRTWLLLDPVAKSQYDREARIRDLVLRMATVRDHRVQASFVSDPYDPDHGLLRSDGRPDELLLPWRTTSRLLGNLRRVGSLKLRSQAANAVFAGSGRAVLLLWSAEPTEELIYLGEGAQSVDAWGRVEDLPVEQSFNQAVHRVQIGPVPRFIIGADPTLLAFRMSVEVERAQLDSLLGQKQKLSVLFTNPTREGMVGEMQIMPPTKAWDIESPRRSWETLAGRSASQDFTVVLGNSAKIGMYEVPIRFELQTVPTKTITVYRRVNVGPEGLDLKVDTRLLPGGDLRVQLVMTNRSVRTFSYDCMLFPPPGRKYQRRFVSLKPGETVRRDIYWPDAQDLIGRKMLLRAVEQEGRRVINYAIDVRR